MLTKKLLTALLTFATTLITSCENEDEKQTEVPEKVYEHINQRHC